VVERAYHLMKYWMLANATTCARRNETHTNLSWNSQHATTVTK